MIKFIEEYIGLILPIVLVVFIGYATFIFATSMERNHKIIIEQSFRWGCNESTQFRKLEYCANAASNYAAKRKEQ